MSCLFSAATSSSVLPSLSSVLPQTHRFSSGTLLITCSACRPHPAHVVLPHLLHVVAQHMFLIDVVVVCDGMTISHPPLLL